MDKIENILSEYGDRVSNVLFFEGYLNEYGKLMVEYDAINVFASLV
jgi:adapter protein MecA 1/2